MSRNYRISSPMRHTDGGLANTLLLIGNMKIGFDGIYLRFDATESGERSNNGGRRVFYNTQGDDYICYISWSQVVKSERLSPATLTMTILLGMYLCKCMYMYV